MALLTYQQLSDRLSVPVGTLYAWVSKGRIPFVRLSDRLVRFDEAVIATWLSQRSMSCGEGEQ